MALEPIPATPENIKHAAKALASGRLVAFPTETVYGLGADAGNGAAVAQIFAAKGRPAFNPLIVHVADETAAARIAHLTPTAKILSETFWPGGLTMVLERRAEAKLSDLVSAGLSSIAVRVPSHPVALALLTSAGCPVAAPSANRSGHVSTTTAAHVAADLGTAQTLEFILDAGPCAFGVESTIVDARGDLPVLLRPGAVTIEEIASVLRHDPVDLISISPADDHTTAGTQARTSPGQLESHYAPAKQVKLNVTTPNADQAWLTFGTPPASHVGEMINLSRNGDLIEASANLFAALRTLDATSARSIAAMPIPDIGLGRAINDRLKRAAAPR